MAIIENLVTEGLFLVLTLGIIIGLLYLGILVCYRLQGESGKDQENKYPKCKCPDVKQCDTWCIAKQRFYEDPPED